MQGDDSSAFHAVNLDLNDGATATDENPPPYRRAYLITTESPMCQLMMRNPGGAPSSAFLSKSRSSVGESRELMNVSKCTGSMVLARRSSAALTAWLGFMCDFCMSFEGSTGPIGSRARSTPPNRVSTSVKIDSRKAVSPG